MNERIKQLAVEAGMIVGEPNGFDMTRLMPKEVKFAELIVKECQLRVEQYINECGEVASMPDTVIMKHFGVEE